MCCKRILLFCFTSLAKVKAFFEDRDAGSGARAVDQAIERIKTNIEWVERSAESIADYLNKKY